ncbi:DNA-J related domain-containing protein [Planctobacterium marinum]|uniref:DnaJ-related protein N-terminal domain-containing protein n=1 Tax=Planctobacterium marinum TaxID=1631968 RepID=A0AA48HQQ3_9ALTE|nr:hypothetical protein MACH26_17600 [Planctobacterium marinum]
MRFEQTLLLDALKVILADGKSRKEFELLQALQEPPWEIFAKNALTSELQLFQTHFTLFHCLYQLQDIWLSDGEGYLKISALHIQLMSEDSVNLIDDGEQKIKAYYNDWRHFSETTERDVEELLDRFWSAFGNLAYWAIPAQEDVKQALAFFTLPDNAPWAQIKRCYLKFQLHNHPDRGGDAQLSKAAAKHFDVLKRQEKAVIG